MKPRPLLLAGGSASRFGSQKLLAEWRGAPLVAHAARRLAEGSGAIVLAVIPLGAESLRRVLEPLGCEVLETDRTTLGLGGSLSAGVEASADSNGWIVALGDMPLVPVETIREVCRALETGAFIAAPEHGGRRGHPVGFSRDLYDELVRLREDIGAREVLQRHRERVMAIASSDPGIFADIDTRDDLKTLGDRPLNS